MKTHCSSVLKPLAICLVALMPSIATAWQYTLSGPGTSDDRFVAVAVDKQGDVYAAGRTGTSACMYNFTVVKVSGETGKPVWTREFCISYYGNGASWLAFDPAGELLVSGQLGNTGGYAGTIFKLASATGAETWRATPAPEVAFLAMDPNGDLALGATGSCPGSGDPPDSVMKLSGKDGSIIWCKGITATGEISGRVSDLVADLSGNFVALGYVHNPSAPPYFYPLAAVKLSGADGREMWRYESGQEMPSHVTVDSRGDVMITGRLYAGTGFLSKLEGGSGAVRWTTPPGTLTSNGVKSLATDGNGDVLLGGTLSDHWSYGDFTVEKVSGQDGRGLWHQLLQTPACGNTIDCHGAANSVGFDPAGDAVGAGGAADLPASGNRAFAVVKFSGATGEMRWSRFIHGSVPGGNDLAFAMAITPEGNVVAAGRISNVSAGVDATIVKLDGRTGADYKPSPLRMVEALLNEVRNLSLAPGTQSSLEAKLTAAERALNEASLPGDASENVLTAFIREVNAQSGKKIDTADAARLAAEAQEILDLLLAAP